MRSSQRVHNWSLFRHIVLVQSDKTVCVVFLWDKGIRLLPSAALTSHGSARQSGQKTKCWSFAVQIKDLCLPISQWVRWAASDLRWRRTEMNFLHVHCDPKLLPKLLSLQPCDLMWSMCKDASTQLKLIYLSWFLFQRAGADLLGLLGTRRKK